MPYLTLQPYVSFALPDGCPVFLDLRRDRYFTLQRPAAGLFRELRASTDWIASEDCSAALLATGLFEISENPCPQPPPSPVVAQEEIADRRTRASPLDVAQTLFLVLRARHAIRSRPLEQVIGEVRKGAQRPRQSTRKSSALAVAQRFRSARALVPVKRACLQDSLALWKLLERADGTPRLVIGVKLNPFAAHCWIEAGGIVLNDAPDRIRKFTPILVTE